MSIDTPSPVPGIPQGAPKGQAGTKIRWTDETWNPTTGCSVVSPGCTRCYAEALSLRFGWSKKPWTAQNAAENVILHPERLRKPYSWKTPKRVFVNSMSDLFHELVPFEYVDRVFDVMEDLPQHTFQILTKRPERMRAYVERRILNLYPDVSAADHPVDWWERTRTNIWLGTSVEDQRRANERIPILLDTPAAVRFLSCEPLLGPVDLEPWLWVNYSDGNGLHWVIAGGESGPHHRPMDPDWARAIRDECCAAAVAFFFKQDSGPRTEMRPWLDGMKWEQYPGQLTPPVAVLQQGESEGEK